MKCNFGLVFTSIYDGIQLFHTKAPYDFLRTDLLLLLQIFGNEAKKGSTSIEIRFSYAFNAIIVCHKRD